jgi:TRAP-type C4-dicarboxylate transport system permease small subunit
MEIVLTLGKRLSWFFDVIGAAVLSGMMFLTVTDVTMRYLGRPFMGTYELVSMAGAIVIGFSIPQTSMQNGHVMVEVLVEGASEKIKKILLVVTKLMGIALFLLLGYALMVKARELYGAQEVSLTLRIPVYPVCFGLGVCSFVEGFVLTALLLKGLVERRPNE